MYKRINQPPFWLEVRKEYAVENFERLLSYLRGYQYITYEANGDFEKSVDCLHDAVEELLADMSQDCLYSNVSTKWGDNTNRNIRMIAAYLLAMNKMNRYDLKVLTALADLLLLMDDGKTVELPEKMELLICACAKNRKVLSYAFTWQDIENDATFMRPLFGEKVARTRFMVPAGLAVGSSSAVQDDEYFYEGHGVITINGNNYSMAAMNYADYTKAKRVDQLTIEPYCHVEVPRKERKNKTGFPDVMQLRRDLLVGLDTVKPSPKITLKDYEPDEFVYIRITAMTPTRIEAETIDPNYNTISGKVEIAPNLHGISRDKFMRRFRIGTYLSARYTPTSHLDYTFSLNDDFEDFYIDRAESAVGRTVDAVWVEEFSGGDRWLGANGLVINVFDKRYNPIIEDAKDERFPIRIRINGAKKDDKNHEVVNGFYRLDENALDETKRGYDFVDRSYNFMAEDYLRCVSNEVDDRNFHSEEIGGIAIDKTYAAVFTHLLFAKSQQSTSTEERYHCLTAAGMAAMITDNGRDAAYIEHECRYLDNLINFSIGNASATLDIKMDDSLAAVERYHRENEVIDQLKRYKDADDSVLTHPQQNEFEPKDIDYLRQVVEASNVLNGRIDISEVNRIKKNIASFLGVGDIYQNIYHELTYYGDESDTLEFKSSAVYPSDNNMRPDIARQKWNILKAICGFLNTVTGGELILGVTDGGYSCGLKNDLEYMAANHIISEAAMDKYRLYIKLLVDSAFADEQGMNTDQSITATHVNYRIERNNEGDDILRIIVRPYEYGIVSFKPDLNRPEYVESSYYRTSGATIPMTKELQKQAWQKKMDTTEDGDTRKTLLLRDAIRKRRSVILKGYQSSKYKNDRNVEPYQLQPEHKAVICYDTDKNEIKEYKISRIEAVEPTGKAWRYPSRHKPISIDIFDMQENQGVKPIDIILKLKPLAYNLLVEEHPASESCIAENNDSDSADYPWVLVTKVNDMKGVGRFYIGLAEQIKIVQGDDLRKYAVEYARKWIEA